MAEATREVYTLKLEGVPRTFAHGMAACCWERDSLHPERTKIPP